MGQKVNPISFHLGVTRDWDSRWFSDKGYAKTVHEDIYIRDQIKQKFHHAGISRIEIERAANRAKVAIRTARPGIIIGRKGAEIDALRSELEKKTGKQIMINIEEIRRAELEAQLVAESVASQLIRRIGFRRAIKKTVLASMKAGAQGVKIMVSGRLGGAEMARCEWMREGRVPLHMLRADIDYGFTTAKTKYGIIGIKVWIFRGERLEKGMQRTERQLVPIAPEKEPRERKRRERSHGDRDRGARGGDRGGARGGDRGRDRSSPAGA
ncbi:MAG: 30S ribosomal protein S3 [Candidatus Sumerlaeota bacterium]|nr:30S ribosomal protein S3 [Candidatus Sumerlaeota bacterium]